MASQSFGLSSLPILVSRASNGYVDQYVNCTIETCAIDTSYYYYRVSLPANATFLALFSISLIAFIATYAFTRRGWAFFFAMFAGVVLEIIGYIGRVMSWKNQWNQPGFVMQIVCLTIAPAFMAGGIYLCLRRIVYAFGPENSRIRPESYTRIFIPCDLLSLILQAAGGGLASSAGYSGTSPITGDDIMVAGLAFQVFTLAIFMALCLDFALCTRRRFNALGDSALDQNPMYVKLRGSWRFKGFIGALSLATVCIFWRSVYRVAELAEGWQGHLIREQNLFIAFEGVMVVVACLALSVFHPAVCFGEGMAGKGGVGSGRKERREAEKEAENEGQTMSASTSTSDVDRSVV
ncbi:RTA1 domain containing protein [Hyaloscypha variabilis]